MMDDVTRKALEGSIAHWERLLKCVKDDDPAGARQEGWGPDSCALCQEFYDNGCEGCPVKAITGYLHCIGSPWYRANWALNVWTTSESAERFDAFGAVSGEVEFLKWLRPQDDDSFCPRRTVY